MCLICAVRTFGPQAWRADFPIAQGAALGLGCPPHTQLANGHSQRSLGQRPRTTPAKNQGFPLPQQRSGITKIAFLWGTTRAEAHATTTMPRLPVAESLSAHGMAERWANVRCVAILCGQGRPGRNDDRDKSRSLGFSPGTNFSSPLRATAFFKGWGRAGMLGLHFVPWRTSCPAVP